MVAQLFEFSQYWTLFCEIPMDSPRTRASNRGGVYKFSRFSVK